MEQSKSPKSLAYARTFHPPTGLGKPQPNKNSQLEQQKKGKRNSTGTIYQEMLQQIPSDAHSYIRELVNKNQKETATTTPSQQLNNNMHSRRKSYAEIIIDSSSKEKEKTEKVKDVREERETLCRQRFAIQNTFLQQVTPKNATAPLNKRSSAPKNISSNQSNCIMINSFKKQSARDSTSFLDNLNTYLDDLHQIPNPKINLNSSIQKLSQTLKIGPGQGQSFKLISRLQQSQLKIKQLKLKQYYHEKQKIKYIKKQQKMKNSLFDMLGEIKHLTAQLSYQKKQRKKLQKIIDSFEIRNSKPQRKTMDKYYHKYQQLQNQFNTESEYDKDFQSSFRDHMKNSTHKRMNFGRNNEQNRNRQMNTDKIQKLFKSHMNSQQESD